MLLKWVINLDNRNLQYSAFQFPVNRLPNIPSTLSFEEDGQGKVLRTKLYGGSGTTSSAKARQFYQIVVVRLNRPLHILEYSSRFPSFFATNISYQFHISSKPPIPTQFLRHILCTVFDQSLDITVVFQNQPFDLFWMPCHVLIFHTCTDYNH